MKRIVFILTGLSILLLNIKSQNFLKDPNYGPDSISRMNCAKNKSLYSEFFKQNNFEDALAPWYEVFHNCPKASQNTYIDGPKIIKYFIDKETNETKKASLIDTLMKIYDKRIELFGREGYNLGRKALDFWKYRNEKPEDIETAYQMLDKSINLSMNNSEEAILLLFMSVNEIMVKNNKISSDQLIANYSNIINILDAKIKSFPKDSLKFIETKAGVNVIFERVAPSCESIVSLYEPKFKANPDDISQNELIVNLLEKRNCIKEDLYFNALIKYHKNKPTLANAVKLGDLCRSREKYNDAVNYYKEAVNLETDNILKANYYLKLADIYRKLENLSTARDYARLAIEANPASGEPYVFIGYLYAMSANNCGNNEVEKNSVYWAAVDKFIKAKSIDPSVAEECDRNIGIYSKYYPSKEEIFFQGLKEGDNYTVKCWINETTTVRSR